MNRVNLLPESVANLIAAGEVVERPASVVKELIENAIDSGADEIEVEISQAGFKRISVNDNGCGMNPEDAERALLRHATSKITHSDDLNRIVTLGFRGEALPAIAAVSRMELKTRPVEQETGLKISLEGHEKISQQEIGMRPGTSISVADLFFNTPVRKKFMKSQTTEQNHILRVVEAAALSNPGIYFKLRMDERDVLVCKKTTELTERIYEIFHDSMPPDMIRLEQDYGQLRLFGLIDNGQHHRNTRDDIHLFVNRRPIDNKSLMHGIIQAYRPLLPEKRFPVCFIFLHMPADQVDVNVHPAKREVKFQDESGMYRLVYSAIREKLQQTELVDKEKRIFNQGINSETSSPVFEFSYLPEKLFTSEYTDATSVKEPEGLYIKNHPTGESINVTAPELRILGQVGRTYIAGQDQNGFFMIDQHAAHEKILFEEYQKWPANAIKQALLIPVTMELVPSRALLLQSLLPDLDEIGFEINFLGGNTFSVQTRPEGMQPCEINEIIEEMMNWRESHGNGDRQELETRTKISMACKAAIKAGERLQPETMLSLGQKLFQTTPPYTCPHGRPIIFRLSWAELDRIFKRNYAS